MEINSLGVSLFKAFGGVVSPHQVLPENSKKAVYRYYIEEMSVESVKAKSFEYVELPTEAIIRTLQIADPTYKDFNKHHKEYMSEV